MNIIIGIILYVLGCFLTSLILHKMDHELFGEDGAGYILVVIWPLFFVILLVILVGLFLNFPVVLLKYVKLNKKDNNGKQN